MCEKLRKVTFRLNYVNGFVPDLTEKEEQEKEEQERERQGYFHEWASTTEPNENVSFRVNKVGIVEEKGTGQIHYVFPDLITFNDDPYEMA